MLATRLVSRRIPGALIAIAGAIVASHLADLDTRGVATVGSLPRALPHFGLPALGFHDAGMLLGIALSMFVVILAQSAATARAYAVKYREALDENTDLVGLGAANVAAAFSGTFVVNGSPTKTEIVDSAGGRSQLAQLVTSAVVLVAALLLTGLACRPADRGAGGGGLPDRPRPRRCGRDAALAGRPPQRVRRGPGDRGRGRGARRARTASSWPSWPRSSTI